MRLGTSGVLTLGSRGDPSLWIRLMPARWAVRGARSRNWAPTAWQLPPRHRASSGDSCRAVTDDTPRPGSAQHPHAHLNGPGNGAPGCADRATAQTTRALLTNWAHPARPRRRGGARHRQHRRAWRTSPHTRPAAPGRARAFPLRHPRRHHRSARPAANCTPSHRADRLQRRQESGPNPPHRGRQNAIGVKWSPR